MIDLRVGDIIKYDSNAMFGLGHNWAVMMILSHIDYCRYNVIVMASNTYSLGNQIWALDEPVLSVCTKLA